MGVSSGRGFSASTAPHAVRMTERKRSRTTLLAVATLAAWVVAPEPASAYIGPGAGIAFLSGGLVLVGSLFLAFAILLVYPLKILLRLVTGAGRIKGDTKRLVIIGFDGMDP